MTELFGIPLPALLSQLLLGLVNGSFYAILSLGLAVIFGLLNVINFAHGALYMMGAIFAWMGLTYFGLNYWVMLVVAPLLVGGFGVSGDGVDQDDIVTFYGAKGFQVPDAVTRADALISVHAGFRDAELGALWPSAGWTVDEYAAGLFSHCFAARRTDR